MSIAIIVVAFNRVTALKRLLQSLAVAKYPHNQVPLIISIDRGSNNSDVLEIANQFVWKFGEKQVIYQETNLGLRKHIIKCGTLTHQYENVIVLEDDLVVSPYFYTYAQQALQFAEGKDYIGGISLYNHMYNVHTWEPFYPLEDGFDNWYFQFASSWGEAWSRKQWDDFLEWYEKNQGINLASDTMPKSVSSWSEKSWLKYFIKYLIETDRYFIYPRVSLSTNCSDVGTHASEKGNSVYQIPLLQGVVRDYYFSELCQSNSIYDAFYESKTLAYHLGSDITVDLYGFKPVPKTGKIITRKILGYKVLDSYGCSYRPQETNIIRKTEGNIFFLYDLSRKDKKLKDSKTRRNSINRYRYKVVSRESLFDLIFDQLVHDFKLLRKKIKF